MKQKIIEQSIQLFEQKGFSETSIQDIVDMLHVTKGTFYYYFESKEQLLMDIQTKYIDELLASQQQILADSGKSCEDKVFETIQLLLKDIKIQGRMAKVFFRELRNLNEDHYLLIKRRRQQFRRNLQNIIDEGMESGVFRNDLRSDFVTFAILGMCNWSYQWFNPSGEASDDELIALYVDLFLNGMKRSSSQETP